MTKKIFLLIIACTVVLSACNFPTAFKANITTDKKPWTNLKFNNDPDNFQFAIMADRNGGSRKGVFEDAVQKINLMQPEFVLNVGDLIAGYTTDTSAIAKQWKEVNDIISGLKMPFFYLPGNHDITNKIMEKEWEKLYGKRYYHFQYKNTLFIILDSNDDDDFNLTRAQTDYVLKTLKENSQVRWTFVLMHHPIWQYNTDGRFQEIESALKDRKFTVIAGHEHHYHQIEKNGANYYILSTTGAGSALRGNYFGEFDHIAWITMNNNGPVMANLRLDGILPHDISNDKTKELAGPLVNNAKLSNLLLCNRGYNFTNGTLYLSFKNPTKSKLMIEINFFHHHQLQIKDAAIKAVAEPESEKVIEVPLVANMPLDYKSIDLLLMDWTLKYDNPDYKDFALSGKCQVEVKPSNTSFIDKEINLFTDQTTVPFKNPFDKLESVVNINNTFNQPYLQPIPVSQTTTLSFYVKNSKNEYTAPETRFFEKTAFREPTEVANPQEGLAYNYYEGNYTEIPDFGKLQAVSNGVAKNFEVSDLSKREDNWALVFNGYIKIAADDFYLFRTRADDLCRLTIDNQIVVNEKPLKNGLNMGAIALKKGFHTVKFEFVEIQGDARLRFYSKVEKDKDWKTGEFGSFFH